MNLILLIISDISTVYRKRHTIADHRDIVVPTLNRVATQNLFPVKIIFTFFRFNSDKCYHKMMKKYEDILNDKSYFKTPVFEWVRYHYLDDHLWYVFFCTVHSVVYPISHYSVNTWQIGHGAKFIHFRLAVYSFFQSRIPLLHTHFPPEESLYTHSHVTRKDQYILSFPLQDDLSPILIFLIAPIFLRVPIFHALPIFPLILIFPSILTFPIFADPFNTDLSLYVDLPPIYISLQGRDK